MSFAKDSVLSVLILFFTSTAGAVPYAGPVLPAGSLGTDRSDLFYELLSDYQDGAEATLPEALKSTHVIFIPGILSAMAPGFMTKQMQWLNDNGYSAEQIEATRGGFDGENEPSENALILAKVIAAVEKEVVIISHSKGSLETLMALINEPELRSKVRGWISLQSVFYGSPVADKICGSWDGLIWEKFIGKWMGSPNTIQTLTEADRTPYLLDNMERVREITADINTLSFASWAHRSQLAPLLRPLIWFYGEDMDDQYPSGHDGLLPLGNALLPSSPYVVGAEMDHFSIVLGTHRVVPSEVILRSLLTVLFEQEQ